MGARRPIAARRGAGERPIASARSGRSARRPFAARRSAGLTLLETLVVFVLVALLGATLVQGVGFFSGQHVAAQRIHRGAYESSLRQRWFLDTVQGLNPYGVEAQRFVGDAASFSGITLQPLFAEPGMPVRARWRIDAIAAPAGGAPAQTVAYQEDGGRSWRVFSAERELFFQYADAAGQWHDRWPAAAAPREWTPTLIRLASPSGDLWLARVEASPTPVLTEALLQ